MFLLFRDKDKTSQISKPTEMPNLAVATGSFIRKQIILIKNNSNNCCIGIELYRSREEKHWQRRPPHVWSLNQ